MSESRDRGESRGCSYSSESRTSYSSESRDTYSYSARKTRDELSTADIGRAIKKQKQDMANQVQHLKKNLMNEKGTLQRRMAEIEEEIKRLEQLEREI